MVSDSQCTVNGLSFSSKKLFRIAGCVVGMAGNTNRFAEFVRQLESFDGDLTRLTNPSKDDSAEFRALVIREGMLYHIGDDFEVDFVDSKVFAIGSGAAHALTAFDCGKSLQDCVRLAAKRDSNTALPLQALKAA